MKVYLNFADIILSSAFLLLYELICNGPKFLGKIHLSILLLLRFTAADPSAFPHRSCY